MASAAEQLAANMNFGPPEGDGAHKAPWFTLLALVATGWRAHPIPGIDLAPSTVLRQAVERHPGMFNISRRRGAAHAIFALNVSPTSRLDHRPAPGHGVSAVESAEGRRGAGARRSTVPRYLTVVLALLQSFAIATGLQSSNIAVNPGPFFLISHVVTLTAAPCS